MSNRFLEIGTPVVQIADGTAEMSASLLWDDEATTLRLRGPAAHLALADGDAFLISVLPMAMKLGLPIISQAPVSERLLRATEHIQSMFCSWYPSMHRVPIQAALRTPPVGHHASGTACFFSGGVDSWFSVLRQLSSVDTLVLVHGFDIPLANLSLRTEVSTRLHQAAHAIGKPLIEVESNVREVTDRFVSWPKVQVGAALAAVGASLRMHHDRVLIPSSTTYDTLTPLGSHPMMDPLWSTQDVSMVNDGTEAMRVEKLALIATSDSALASLRVCWLNPDNAFNCGCCEKCVRTMLGLEANGALVRCPTFVSPLTAQAVRSMGGADEDVLYYCTENLRALRVAGLRPDLQAALASVLEQLETDEVMRRLRALWPRRKASVLKVIARLMLGRQQR